jgi:hypothetical protein
MRSTVIVLTLLGQTLASSSSEIHFIILLSVPGFSKWDVYTSNKKPGAACVTITVRGLHLHGTNAVKKRTDDLFKAYQIF